MCHDAQTARDIAKAELQRQEELNVRVRKEKEKELMEYKRQADEKKEFAERVERRLNRMSLSNQDDTAVGACGPCHHTAVVGVSGADCVSSLSHSGPRGPQ